MDSNGLADPYVKLHLLPGASKVKDRPLLHQAFTSFKRFITVISCYTKKGGDVRLPLFSDEAICWLKSDTLWFEKANREAWSNLVYI